MISCWKIKNLFKKSIIYIMNLN